MQRAREVEVSRALEEFEIFIDEAYYLFCPENEQDYGQESIEILLQMMENNREDLVVVLAGYKDRMEKFFQSNPGMSSRIAHHLDFPDYSPDELLAIAHLMLEGQQYRFSADAEKAFKAYIIRRMQLPHFANARSIRNALDCVKLIACSTAGEASNLLKRILLPLRLRISSPVEYSKREKLPQ